MSFIDSCTCIISKSLFTDAYILIIHMPLEWDYCIVILANGYVNLREMKIFKIWHISGLRQSFCSYIHIAK